MIAPSPDWFVGVHDVDLLADGYWMDDLTIDLYAYDSGTDSGTGFTSGNQNTNPQAPITMQTGGPFFGTTPLGTFTFTRLSSTLRYGSGINPEDSLAYTGLAPGINKTLPFEMSDPTGTMATPASTFFAIAADPMPFFPAGPLLPGRGMTAPGSAGELLIDIPLIDLQVGGMWTGTPVPFNPFVPNDPALVGMDFYCQGVMLDATGRFGLTSAIEILLGS